jgi:DNA-binding CsgD family transcriptional regulator
MSVLAAMRGWRVSFVNASTKRIRWSHRIEHISRPSGLFLLRETSTSKIQAGTSEQSTPVGGEAKLQQPHGFTRTEQNDLPVLATAGPDQSTKSLTAEEKEVVAEMRRGDYSRLRIAQFLGCDLRVVHDALYQLGPIDSRRSKLPRFRLSDSELKRAEALRR